MEPRFSSHLLLAVYEHCYYTYY